MPREHTPGPWEWHWRDGDTEAPGSVVAVGYPNHPNRPMAVAMCPKYRGPNHGGGWEADARLMAASPALLSEAVRCREELAKMEDMHHVDRLEWFESVGIDLLYGLDESIAKATGDDDAAD